MKQVYIVKSYGYRDPVAFADKESADGDGIDPAEFVGQVLSRAGGA